MKTYVATILDGKLSDPELMADLSNPAAQGIEVEVTIESLGNKKRTVQQNRRLWGVIYKKALAYYKENPADFIRDLMTATRAEITVEFVHEMMKIWWLKGESTTKLSTERMNGYTDAIEEHLFHRHGVPRDEPEEKEDD